MQEYVVEGQAREKLPGVSIEGFDRTLDPDQVVEIEARDLRNRLHFGSPD